MPTSMRTTLGKRPRGEEETRSDLQGNSIDGLRKKVKGKEKTNRVLEAGGTISRAHQMSTTRTLVEIKSKSEAVGRGAGQLMAQNAHELYSQFLPGPSVQQELVVTAAQGELPWMEGSAEEVAWDYTDSNKWQQEAVNGANDEESEDEQFEIPGGLSQRQMGLLEATPDDLARRKVRELKCRLCPGAGFGNWEDYKRHCKFMEAHPITLVLWGLLRPRGLAETAPQKSSRAMQKSHAERGPSQADSDRAGAQGLRRGAGAVPGN
jgi:hypothetical protein